MEKVRVAATNEIAEGTQKYAIIHGKKLYVSRIGGSFYASQCACPCPLSGGILNRIVEHEGVPCVECDARCYTLGFDLRTGENTRGDDYSIQVHSTTVADGAVFVEIESSGETDISGVDGR